MAATAISTAAKPTKECINATVSGICVIGTVRARAIPTIAPSTIAPTIIQTTGFSATKNVVITAIAIAIMP